MSADKGTPKAGPDGAYSAEAREMRSAFMAKAIELRAMLETTCASYEPGYCPEAALEHLDDVIGYLDVIPEDPRKQVAEGLALGRGIVSFCERPALWVKCLPHQWHANISGSKAPCCAHCFLDGAKGIENSPLIVATRKLGPPR